MFRSNMVEEPIEGGDWKDAALYAGFVNVS